MTEVKFEACNSFENEDIALFEHICEQRISAFLGYGAEIFYLNYSWLIYNFFIYFTNNAYKCCRICCQKK